MKKILINIIILINIKMLIIIIIITIINNLIITLISIIILIMIIISFPLMNLQKDHTLIKTNNCSKTLHFVKFS